MDIIINALYTHKEVFLRELISNASDALDKIRYLALKDPAQLAATKDLKIMIEFNKDDKTISVTDTGVGMTKEELIKNLGTVAKSGTAAFVEALSKGEAANLIGQFGVGFYSTYLVAKQVVVASKHNDDDQYLWISKAGSQFSVIKDPKGNTLLRGTKVTIYLKEDAIELVEQETIKNIVKKYSEFINYPIYLYTEKEVTKEVENKTAEADNKTAEAVNKTVEETNKTTEAANKTTESVNKTDEEKVEVKEEKKEEAKPEEKKNMTITEKVWDWVLVNEQKALWLRNKEEIKEEEYTEFYKTLSKGTEEPLAHTHLKAEGDIEFSAILFIPSSTPFDLYENYYGKSKAIKLYVKRVMITEEFEDLMPRYMNFIRGVLDSDDLPLNVNREMLQQQKAMKVISKKLVRSTIKLLEGMARGNVTTNGTTNATSSKNTTEQEKYEKFYGMFGKNIKLGVIEDSSNRLSLSKLLRFYSTKSLNKTISFDDYLERKKPKQDVIYYLAGDNKEFLLKSPLIQKLKDNDIEVLLLEDPIDEYCMNALQNYDTTRIQNAAKGDVKMFKDEELEKKRLQKLKEIFKPLTVWWKTRLGKKVEKVEVATRLTDSPCAISTSEYGNSANMEKITRSQTFSNKDKVQAYMLARKTLEINPGHPIIKKLLEKVQESPTGDPDPSFVELSDVLFDTAIVNSGFNIDDSAVFFEKIERIVRKGFEIDANESVVQPEVNITDDDDDGTNKLC